MKKKTGVAVVLMFVILMLAATPTFAKEMAPFKANVKATATAPSGLISGQDVLGSGVASHMGKVSVYQHHTVNLATGEFYDGVFLWTAANGDLLIGTYRGFLVPINSESFEIQGHFDINGGTGRFQHATGGGTASGTQRIDGTAELILDGSISY